MSVASYLVTSHASNEVDLAAKIGLSAAVTVSGLANAAGAIPIAGGAIAGVLFALSAGLRANSFNIRLQEIVKRMVHELAYTYSLFRLIETARLDDGTDAGAPIVPSRSLYLRGINHHLVSIIEKCQQAHPVKKGVLARMSAWSTSEDKFTDLEKAVNEMKNDLDDLYKSFEILTHGKSLRLNQKYLDLFTKISTIPLSGEKDETTIEVEAIRESLEPAERKPSELAAKVVGTEPMVSMSSSSGSAQEAARAAENAALRAEAALRQLGAVAGTKGGTRRRLTTKTNRRKGQ